MLRFVFLLLSIACCVLATSPAHAHPLGNYSINQYFLVDMRVTPPDVYYLVDMAEIPSFTELDLLDTDFDSEVTDEETEQYLSLKVPALLANLSMEVGGEAVGLSLTDRQMSLLAGQGGMVIFNVLLKLEPASWPEPATPFVLGFTSENYVNESGVRECMAVLDNHFVDDTRSLGEDRLKYQTLVFLDDNRNPVYQDFDGGFELQLDAAEGEPISGDAATRIAFEWTSTAQGAEESGEQELVAAMQKDLSVSETAVAPDAEASEAPAEGNLDTGEVPPVNAPGNGESPDESMQFYSVSGIAVLIALVVGVWLGRLSTGRQSKEP